MKDISVTLGKIEERFGEKLNSLNDKMSHFEKIKEETSEQIEGKEEDKDRMIEDLMKRANLSNEERETFKEEIAKREKEIESLKEQRYRAERNAARLQRKMDSLDEEWGMTPMLNRRRMIELLENEKLPENLSIKMRESLRRRGYADSEGRINRSAILKDLQKYEVI